MRRDISNTRNMSFCIPVHWKVWVIKICHDNTDAQGMSHCSNVIPLLYEMDHWARMGYVHFSKFLLNLHLISYERSSIFHESYFFSANWTVFHHHRNYHQIRRKFTLSRRIKMFFARWFLFFFLIFGWLFETIVTVNGYWSRTFFTIFIIIRGRLSMIFITCFVGCSSSSDISITASITSSVI